VVLAAEDLWIATGAPRAVFLRDAAWLLLADLAEDGDLSPAEGLPMAEVLLAAQQTNGSFTPDFMTHAIATWAVAEAAWALPREPRLAAAAERAAEYLHTWRIRGGWPQRPDGPVDGETTRVCTWVADWPIPHGVSPAQGTMLLRPSARLLAALPRGNLAAGTLGALRE
jgi:hypothetical protein